MVNHALRLCCILFVCKTLTMASPSELVILIPDIVENPEHTNGLYKEHRAQSTSSPKHTPIFHNRLKIAPIENRFLPTKARRPICIRTAARFNELLKKPGIYDAQKGILDLSNQNIAYIGEDALKATKWLLIKKIILSHNPLYTLPRRFFVHHEALEELYLEDTLIEDINVWFSLSKLRRISLAHTPLARSSATYLALKAGMWPASVTRDWVDCKKTAILSSLMIIVLTLFCSYLMPTGA